MAWLGCGLSIACAVRNGDVAGQPVFVADAVEARGVDFSSRAFEAGAEAAAGYAEGTGLMFPVLGLGVPPCWRAYFLLLRQKKVAKEKATPGFAPGYAGFPALLGAGGGCGTRAYGPQTVLALFPPAPALLGAPHGGPTGVSAQTAAKKLACCGRPPKKGKNQIHDTLSAPDGLPGPLRGAEQRRVVGGRRLALFEPQASLASRPTSRVAQGTGVASTDPGVAFSLATFFWPHKRKYARQQGGNPCQSKR